MINNILINYERDNGTVELQNTLSRIYLSMKIQVKNCFVFCAYLVPIPGRKIVFEKSFFLISLVRSSSTPYFCDNLEVAI